VVSLNFKINFSLVVKQSISARNLHESAPARLSSQIHFDVPSLAVKPILCGEIKTFENAPAEGWANKKN